MGEFVFKLKENSINLITDLVSLFIGLVALSISIYYSMLWLWKYAGFPFIIALFLAFAYIVFLNIVFEGAISFFRQAILIKNNSLKIRESNKPLYKRSIQMQISRILIGLVIMFVWFFLTAYSMISTVAGQYGQIIKIEESKSTVRKDADFYTEQLNSIEEQMEFIMTQNTSYQEELNILLDRAKSINTIEDRYKYRNTTGSTEERIDELRKSIETNTSQINALLIEKRGLLKDDSSDFSINFGSVYTYFSKITGLPELLIQVVLSLFPSVFVDIISPVAFAIFIYRKK
jgi:hypothetical protein